MLTPGTGMLFLLHESEILCIKNILTFVSNKAIIQPQEDLMIKVHIKALPKDANFLSEPKMLQGITMFDSILQNNNTNINLQN